jgi:internalin A
MLHGEGLTDISALAGLTTLTQLQIYNCGGIADISKLSSLKNLEWYDAHNDKSITSVAALDSLTKLKYVDLHYCQGLDSLLSDFSGLTALAHLNINGCSTLKSAPSLAGLKNLSWVDIRYNGLDSASIAGIVGDMDSGDTLYCSSDQVNMTQAQALVAKGVILPGYVFF